MASSPTYLVAVCGGNIYMGYSPVRLTLCTGGSAALRDSPVVGLAAGPPSPNDTGDGRYQRFVYFVDGLRYRRLNANTGAVSAWTAFNGVDAVSGAVIKGLLPFGSNLTVKLLAVGPTGYLVEGNVVARFAVGAEFAVQNTPSDDGFYTVASRATEAGNTRIQTSPPPVGTTVLPISTLSNVLGRATLIAHWNGRIVLAGLPGSEGAWMMSAVNDPRNWEYAPVTPTATMAVAGGIGEALPAEDNITALMPLSDDVLAIGCRTSLWVMRGDPASGGDMVNVSREAGVAGRNAWATDPQGRLYFLAASGLYLYDPRQPGGAVSVSHTRLRTAFARFDLTTTRAVLAYDQSRDWLLISLARDGTAETESYVYVPASESFWPIRLHRTNGPSSAVWFSSPAAQDRTLILGGADGRLRTWRDRRTADAVSPGPDEPIESRFTIGPIAAQPSGPEIVVSDIITTFADLSGGMNLSVFTGPTPERAGDAVTPVFTDALTGAAGRSARRVRGGAVVLEISQTNMTLPWAYSDGSMVITAAGATIRRRV